MNRRNSQPPVVTEHRSVLLMMAKYPQPGQVKTRLAATIGAQAAAELQRVFIRHLCTSLVTCGQRRQLLASPDDRCAALASNIDAAWATAPQGDGDLGQRMWRGFRRALSGPEPPAAVVMIGADLPTLCAGDIQAAVAQLADNDVVLGPASDGGYYLIGLRGGAAVLPALSDVASSGARSAGRIRYESLFQGISWGSSEVLAQTQRRAQRGKLAMALLPEREDIDTEVQLQRLMQQLRRSRAARDVELREQIDAVFSAHHVAGVLSAQTNTN